MNRAQRRAADRAADRQRAADATAAAGNAIARTGRYTPPKPAAAIERQGERTHLKPNIVADLRQSKSWQEQSRKRATKAVGAKTVGTEPATGTPNFVADLPESHPQHNGTHYPDEPPTDHDHYGPPDDGHYSRPPDDDEHQGDDPAEGAIAYQLHLLRIRQEAKRRLNEELHPPVQLPPVKSLNALLAEPDQPSQYRIKDLAPLGGRVLLSAQYKAGKTTMVSNLLRSLADNTPFLGHFDISTPAERIALADDELSENMLRLWLREQKINNTAAVVDIVSLRGKLSSFNPMDDRNRTQWATRWRDLGVDYLVLDCLRPILDAHGLDENRDAGTFLVAFDALLEEAGIKDSTTLHHMGHANERARGDSRLQDWPDAIWRVMRETEEPDSPRYFSAFGRDVNVPEGQLIYDQTTRRLTYANGTRTEARLDKARADVIELLVAAAAKGTKPNGSAIEAELVPPHTQKALRQAVALLVRRGLVAVEDGPRNAKLHSIAHPCTECRLPVVTGRERHESCPANIEELTLE